MTRWGRGGLVGVRKAIYEHERLQKQAAVILEREHGVGHRPGERADLCPKCQTVKPYLDQERTKKEGTGS